MLRGRARSGRGELPFRGGECRAQARDTAAHAIQALMDMRFKREHALIAVTRKGDQLGRVVDDALANWHETGASGRIGIAGQVLDVDMADRQTSRTQRGVTGLDRLFRQEPRRCRDPR